jgi:signal peptide peptidase SppA
VKLIDLITAPWAIQPEKLTEILAIYGTHVRGDEVDIQAIEARLGRPLASEQQDYEVRDGGVAVLSIDGVIAPKANLFTQISGGASAQLLQRQVESAIADPRVKALVLAIDSPGGSVFGAPELAAAVHGMSKDKPIVAVSDGTIASAAYWIGSAANALFISGPTVHAGSIGVVMTHKYDPRATNTTEITAGKYKRIASDVAPLTAEGRAHLQERVDHIYSVFVDAVAQHRGVGAEQVLAHMADGRVFVGQQALDVGLVDGFASIDDLVAQLAADPGAYAKRRRAKPMAKPSSKTVATVPAASVPQPPSQGELTMDRKTLETEHTALFAELRDHFRTEGAAAERERIQAVENACLPGHEKLIASLKFDGKTGGGEAALAVMAAERQLRTQAAATLGSEAPKPAAPAAAPAVEAKPADPMADASQPLEERCKAKWESDPAVRAEFSSLSAFTAITRAEEAGKVRVLKGRASA